MPRHRELVLAAMLACCAASFADEVIFKNGDHLTGTVDSIDGGKMKFKSKAAGDVTIDMNDVQTFSTDNSVQLWMKDRSLTQGKLAAVATAPATQPAAVIAEGREVGFDQIKRLGPGEKWSGSAVVNGSLARGNTHSENLGAAADATLRRDDQQHDDRLGIIGGYNFGKQTVAGVNSTSADNWFAQAKYDIFFTEKWYAYALLRYDHDRLAFLNYRLSPGVGVGYQWIETPDFNFSTEAGVSYVYEDYSNDGNDDRVALRLAYHVDKKLSDAVSFVHNLEWLPSFNNPADYNLNVDAGLRAKISGSLFSEFKVVYQRDSTPAPGAQKDDVRLLLGIGYSF